MQSVKKRHCYILHKLKDEYEKQDNDYLSREYLQTGGENVKRCIQKRGRGCQLITSRYKKYNECKHLKKQYWIMQHGLGI